MYKLKATVASETQLRPRKDDERRLLQLTFSYSKDGKGRWKTTKDSRLSSYFAVFGRLCHLLPLSSTFDRRLSGN